MNIAGFLIEAPFRGREYILIQARSDGRLALPCGHFEPAVDAGLLETAVRETWEESGIRIPLALYKGRWFQKELSCNRVLTTFHIALPRVTQWENHGPDAYTECRPFPKFPSYFPILPATFGHAWVEKDWLQRPENECFTMATVEILSL